MVAIVPMMYLADSFAPGKSFCKLYTSLPCFVFSALSHNQQSPIPGNTPMRSSVGPYLNISRISASASMASRVFQLGSVLYIVMRHRREDFEVAFGRGSWVLQAI